MDMCTKIAIDFREFINSYDCDSYEVAICINQILSENGISSRIVNRKIIGVDLFDEIDNN